MIITPTAATLDLWGRDFGSERDQVGEEDGAKDGHTAATLA